MPQLNSPPRLYPCLRFTVSLIRAVPVRSKTLNDAADDAYAAKYTTKANARYVKGLAMAERKVNTLELIPA